MDKAEKDFNIQVGKRLRESREKLGCTQAVFAELLGVSTEHYRKYESGATRVSGYKQLLLYNKYGISPFYLITGTYMHNTMDVSDYLANCSKEQQVYFLEQSFAYILKRLIT